MRPWKWTGLAGLAERLVGVGAVLGLVLSGSVSALAEERHPDPNQVLPMSSVPPQWRDSVAEVIRDNSFHQQGQPDTFPCNPRIYLHLLDEPVLTLGLWQDLSPTPATLRQVGPGSFSGTDGAGTSATWKYLIRTPRLHAFLCDLDYVTPRGNARLQGRLVLVVHSSFFREQGGEFWVKHDVEIFVKIDSRGWKAVGATLRPLIEKVLGEQIQEAGWFVSLMARLVEMYPEWASQTSDQLAGLPPESRTAFRTLVEQTRRPGAYSGRPRMAEAPGEETARR